MIRYIIVSYRLTVRSGVKSMNIGIKLGLAVVMGLTLPGSGGEQTEHADIYYRSQADADAALAQFDGHDQHMIVTNRNFRSFSSEVALNRLQLGNARISPGFELISDYCRRMNGRRRSYQEPTARQVEQLTNDRIVTFHPISESDGQMSPWQMRFESNGRCAFIFDGRVSEASCNIAENHIKIVQGGELIIDVFRCSSSDRFVTRYVRGNSIRHHWLSTSPIER